MSDEPRAKPLVPATGDPAAVAELQAADLAV